MDMREFTVIAFLVFFFIFSEFDTRSMFLTGRILATLSCASARFLLCLVILDAVHPPPLRSSSPFLPQHIHHSFTQISFLSIGVRANIHLPEWSRTNVLSFARIYVISARIGVQLTPRPVRLCSYLSLHVRTSSTYFRARSLIFLPPSLPI